MEMDDEPLDLSKKTLSSTAKTHYLSSATEQESVKGKQLDFVKTLPTLNEGLSGLIQEHEDSLETSNGKYNYAFKAVPVTVNVSPIKTKRNVEEQGITKDGPLSSLGVQRFETNLLTCDHVCKSVPVIVPPIRSERSLKDGIAKDGTSSSSGAQRHKYCESSTVRLTQDHLKITVYPNYEKIGSRDCMGTNSSGYFPSSRLEMHARSDFSREIHFLKPLKMSKKSVEEESMKSHHSNQINKEKEIITSKHIIAANLDMTKRPYVDAGSKGHKQFAFDKMKHKPLISTSDCSETTERENKSSIISTSVGTHCSFGSAAIQEPTMQFYTKLEQIVRKSSFLCNECNKTFHYRAHLIRHSRSHRGVKPYSCKSCGRAFTQNSSRERHEIICKPWHEQNFG